MGTLPTTTSFSSQDKSRSRCCHPQTYKKDTGLCLLRSAFPIHTRYAYLFGSPVPLLDHCVHLPADLTTGAATSFTLTHSSIRAFFCVCVHTQPPESVGLYRPASQLLSVGPHSRAGRPSLRCCADSGSDPPYFHPDIEPGSMSSDFKEALFISWYSIKSSPCRQTELSSCLSGELQTLRPLLLWIP